jgi:uncharacterized protein (TIGR02145 family)
VTDTTTSQPLQAVPVKLNPVNDTTSTASDGKYLFKSLIPGDYKIEVSKRPYSKSIRKAAVTSANTTEINFALHKIPYPEFSARYLDFGLDSTLKSFTIKNTGTGKLNYSLFPSQDWITVNPNIGNATNETDTFKVTINRTGLSEKKHIESIEIISQIGLDFVQDTVYVLLNGLIDKDSNYYSVVTIGLQTWMAENLNVGRMIPISQAQEDNTIIEKWCYDCKMYGGLYRWHEMMQYNPSDTGVVGTTQGICSTGWHIPTPIEWRTLYDYLGHADNFVKLNELGFGILLGGELGPDEPCNTNPSDKHFWNQGYNEGFWAANLWWWDPWPCPLGGASIATEATSLFTPDNFYYTWGVSVRCIKDQPKK